MHIVSMISQHRRDFTANFECEHCLTTAEITGYDDWNYHQNVVPAIKCKHCGEISPPEYVPRVTMYPEDMNI